MSENQGSLQCPSLFEKTEQLEQKLIEPAILSDLFCAGDSHDGLHFLFQALKKNDTPDLIKDAIYTVFRSASLKERIIEKWNLYRGYDHAKFHESQMNRYDAYDPASRCIKDCHSCFKDLLEYQMVEPSFFCRTGHSFFWLAVRSDQEDLGKHLLKVMEPEDLMKPFSLSEDRYSIFQASTLFQSRFSICWERLKSSPINAIPSIGPTEIRNICQFIHSDDAEKLRKSGLDLSKPHSKDKAPAWMSVASRRDPEPMLDWLLSRGSEPPEGLLKYVAVNNCPDAATWIMDHTESYDVCRDAAIAAAKSLDPRSVKILAVILPKMSERWKIHRTLFENLMVEIVQTMCEEVTSDLPQMTVVDKEDLAINKIRILNTLTEGIQVVGMKIKAGEAGLYRLQMELEKTGGEF